MNPRDHFKFWDSCTRSELSGREIYSPADLSRPLVRVESRLRIVRRKNSTLSMLEGLQRNDRRIAQDGRRNSADLLNHLQEVRKAGPIGRAYWRLTIAGARAHRLGAAR